jgi:hypothetical protein
MLGIQKIEAAFSRDGSPEIPVGICYTDIFIDDHWEELTSKSWWYKFSPDLEHQFLWRKEMSEKIDQDWFDLPLGYPMGEEEYYYILDNKEKVFLVDRRNGSKEELERPQIAGTNIALKKPSLPFYFDNIPKDIGEFDIWFDDLYRKENIAYLLKSGKFNLPKKILDNWGRNIFSFRYIPGPLWHCFALWGFEKAMVWIIDKPELIKYACGKFTDYAIDLISISRKIRTKGIWIIDCMTDMVSFEHYKEFNLNFLKSITEMINFNNMYSIHNFCGNPKGKWGLLQDTGADALALEESKKNFEIDIEEVASIIDKKMVLLGNLDAINIFAKGSIEELRSAIIKQARAGKKNGNRFIMCTGSPVTPGTSLTRVREYNKIVRDLRMK